MAEPFLHAWLRGAARPRGLARAGRGGAALVSSIAPSGLPGGVMCGVGEVGGRRPQRDVRSREALRGRETEHPYSSGREREGVAVTPAGCRCGLCRAAVR